MEGATEHKVRGRTGAPEPLAHRSGAGSHGHGGAALLGPAAGAPQGHCPGGSPPGAGRVGATGRPSERAVRTKFPPRK